MCQMRVLAQEALRSAPEHEIGQSLPWADRRFIRERERSRRTHFQPAVTLALVGLIDRDPAMVMHATRHLLSMVHTRHWCQSSESRIVGSILDQRCFVEEVAVTTASLLLDWIGFALSDYARQLVVQAIWDKGLAIIERDMMRHDYLHSMNQGAWFCRARVMGGLMIERFWPRVGDYADRAAKEMRAIMGAYQLPDDGVSQGVGYACLTLEAVLPAVSAYSRARGVPELSVLPEGFERVDNYLQAMASSRPGRVLLDGDNMTDGYVGNAMAMLARILPDSFAARVAATSLPTKEDVYFSRYNVSNLFSLVLGPDNLRAAEAIAPTFALLPQTAILTSTRRDFKGQTVHVHLAGRPRLPSHRHLDIGAFTLEVEGVPLFVNRGQLPYEDERGELLATTSMHNTLTPLRQGLPLNQPSPTYRMPELSPSGWGDEQRLSAAIDLTSLWAGSLQRCRRELESSEAHQLTIRDECTPHGEQSVAFHLHAMSPFHVEANVAIVEHQGVRCRIELPWASSLRCEADAVDCHLRPVHHLTATATIRQPICLTTSFELL